MGHIYLLHRSVHLELCAESCNLPPFMLYLGGLSNCVADRKEIAMARESCIGGQGEEIVAFAREELKHYLALAGDSFEPPRIVVDKE